MRDMRTIVMFGVRVMAALRVRKDRRAVRRIRGGLHVGARRRRMSACADGRLRPTLQAADQMELAALLAIVGMPRWSTYRTRDELVARGFRRPDSPVMRFAPAPWSAAIRSGAGGAMIVSPAWPQPEINAIRVAGVAWRILRCVACAALAVDSRSCRRDVSQQPAASPPSGTATANRSAAPVQAARCPHRRRIVRAAADRPRQAHRERRHLRRGRDGLSPSACGGFRSSGPKRRT